MFHLLNIGNLTGSTIKTRMVISQKEVIKRSRTFQRSTKHDVSIFLFLDLFKDFRRASRVLTEDQIEVITSVKISEIYTIFPGRQFLWCTTQTEMASSASVTLKGSWRTMQDKNPGWFMSNSYCQIKHLFCVFIKILGFVL